MMNSIESTEAEAHLRIDQANVFYNYAIGFETTFVDLPATAAKLLKSGLARAIFFSDCKCVYLDAQGQVGVDWIQPEGRQWDTNWGITFDPKMPAVATTEILQALHTYFHEQHIEAPEAKRSPDYLRASLPPVVLESTGLQLPIFTSIKIFGDGIAILSFQLDCTCDGANEAYFISNFVNLYQRYFDSVWIDSRIQRLDAEMLLPVAFRDKFSFGGRPITGRKVDRRLRQMRRKSRAIFEDSLGVRGRQFEIGDEQWTLHKSAGSKEQGSSESTLELCRSEYFNAVTMLLVGNRRHRKARSQSVYLWEGRPSVTLMRFHEQPATKEDLLNNFASSLSRILMRSATLDSPPALPPDLRPFGDYSFHANRAVFLWTWMRPCGAPESAWDESTTCAKVMANQARSEHIEYYNMRIARACAMAQYPPSADHLMEIYETLASTHDVLHHSSQAGEVSDALEHLLGELGTARLVAPAKEAARFYLDQLRYRSEKRRTRADRWLSFVFGLVGTAGLADFAIRPYLLAAWPSLNRQTLPLVAFAVSGLLVILIALLIWGFTRRGEMGPGL